MESIKEILSLFSAFSIEKLFKPQKTAYLQPIGANCVDKHLLSL
jgi:hypothetical protein